MTKHYIIKKVNTFPKPRRDWNGCVYLGMSLNNRIFHSSDTLKELLSMIYHHTGSLVVLVGDYLHRYNEQIFRGLSEEDAISQSLNKGKELIRIFDETVITSNINITYSYRFTHDFLKDANYNKKKKRLELAHAKKGMFQNLMNYTIDVFLRRQPNAKVTMQEARRLCAQYLIEEIVIFEMLAEEGYTINIYPGNQLPIIKAICTGQLNSISEPLEKIQAIEVKFRPK